MRKTLLLTTITAFVAVILAAFSVVLISSPFVHANGTQTIHLIKHHTMLPIGDVPPKGDSYGDQLVFHDPIFDATDRHQVGQDNGVCVRTVIGKEWECFFTIFLPAGQLTLEGQFYDSGADSKFAITGGTGAYQEARGQMRLHFTGQPVGSAFDYFLTIVD
jgi:allene oxide cyclase